MNLNHTVLRIFEARAKAGKAEALAKKFAGTSIAVVEGKPGNLGYFFGQGLSSANHDLMFVSVWADMDAIRANFGDDWEKSYLPDGYAEIIEHHSVRHVQVDGRLALPSQ